MNGSFRLLGYIGLVQASLRSFCLKTALSGDLIYAEDAEYDQKLVIGIKFIFDHWTKWEILISGRRVTGIRLKQN